VLRAGLSVVIAGRPNAGKSSLLNRLVGDDVAIVTSLPGTTRDLLRQHVDLDGVPVNFVDTAGLRVAVDVVEEEGIRRAKLEMQAADRLLFVVDASLPAPSPPSELRSLPDVPVTLVLNKIDLTGEEPRIEASGGVTRIYVSAQTGAGVHLIREHLKRGAGLLDVGGGALSARRRHLDALERAKQQVTLAAEILTETRASELFAEHLRLAQRALGEITGEFTSDDLLGEIFGSFCIGK
jgi:tRNA modification GTPase